MSNTGGAGLHLKSHSGERAFKLVRNKRLQSLHDAHFSGSQMPCEHFLRAERVLPSPFTAAGRAVVQPAAAGPPHTHQGSCTSLGKGHRRKVSRVAVILTSRLAFSLVTEVADTFTASYILHPAPRLLLCIPCLLAFVRQGQPSVFLPMAFSTPPCPAPGVTAAAP